MFKRSYAYICKIGGKQKCPILFWWLPFIYFFLVFVCNNSFSSAQDSIIHKNLNDKSIDSVILGKDIVDVLKDMRLISRGKPDSTHNKSLGPFLSLIPSVGYEMVSGYTAAVETNISYYNNSSRAKISSILANANYSLDNQSWSIINSNLFFGGEKLNLLGDWRIYHFPTHTYGLGGETQPSASTLIDYKYVRFYEIILGEITPDIYFGIGYMLDYHWNVKELGPIYLITDFQKYDHGKIIPSTTSSGISINLQFDSRKNCNNPKQGAYANIQYRNNLKVLTSDQNWQSLLIDLRKYFTIPSSSGNILAFWSYCSLTLKGNPPYLDLPSIGWDSYNNTGRGYIQGRYRSKNFIDLESEYRFSLTSSDLIGGVAFANISSFSEWPSNAFQTINPGTGLGIRIKLNKQSATNFAADYAIGVKGSKGIFFNMGEVF